LPTPAKRSVWFAAACWSWAPANLLGADLAYDRMAGWTIAKIAFPIAGV
jgi:hypothetical protein